MQNAIMRLFRNFYLVFFILGLSGCTQSKTTSLMKPAAQNSDFQIDSIEFLSDHNLMQEGDGSRTIVQNPTPDSVPTTVRKWYYVNGSVPEIEWTNNPVHIIPMTHTRNTPVVLKLTLKSRATNNITMRCVISGKTENEDELKFEKVVDVQFANGLAVVQLVSDKNLPNKLQKYAFTIKWDIKFNEVKLIRDYPTVHEIYLTAGTPYDLEDTGGVPTTKKLENAYNEIKPFTNSCALEIYHQVIKKFGAYGPKSCRQPTAVEVWQLADRGPTTKPDCISIVTYASFVCGVLGIRGEGESTPRLLEVSAKYALEEEKLLPMKDQRPMKGVIGSLIQPQIFPGDYGAPALQGLNPLWVLRLRDSGNALNAFEGCVEIKSGGKTYYILGGAPKYRYDHIDHVVQIFKDLVWCERKRIPNTSDYDVNVMQADFIYPVTKQTSVEITCPE